MKTLKGKEIMIQTNTEVSNIKCLGKAYHQRDVQEVAKSLKREIEKFLPQVCCDEYETALCDMVDLAFDLSEEKP